MWGSIILYFQTVQVVYRDFQSYQAIPTYIRQSFDYVNWTSYVYIIFQYGHRNFADYLIAQRALSNEWTLLCIDNINKHFSSF